VVRTRQLHRAKRRKVPHPIVALVGYTNAGKSALFNRIDGGRELTRVRWECQARNRRFIRRRRSERTS
jgi:50S ribosomal subunit-associated GTPase HflX